MRIDVSLRQAQEQRLLLLPQMLQAIEILQLSSQDLVAMIEHELSENETLELAEPASELAAERPRKAAEDDGRDFIQQIPSHSLSLHGHLLAQLAVLDIPQEIRELVSFLVGSLDHNGHLALDDSELNEIYGDDAPVAEARRTLTSLDPPGIGQPGPRESMLAQLDPADPDHDVLVDLVVKRLDDLGNNRLPKVARDLSIPIEELKRILPKLRHLDPCPAKAFADDHVEVLRPDVVVRREDGEWQVLVDESRVPPLTIRKDYEDLTQDTQVTGRVKKYLRAKLGSARDLLAAIAQRKETLGRVARAIVDRQRGFLEKGRAGLRPMKMQEIADAVGIHLSTVSRAIAGKFMQTDFGIFAMRELFDGGKGVGAETNGRAGRARASVKERLKRLVASEDKAHPHSDEDLVAILVGEGVGVARRTVAKYRRELGIPSSFKRRAF